MSTITTIAIFFLAFINHSSSARTLTPNNNDHELTFLMQHLLINTSSSTTMTRDHDEPTITTTNFPFSSKPVGLFPPNKGLPVPQYGLSRSFPSLQDLEFGKITLINQELLAEGSDGGDLLKKVVGKAEGVYVASSDDSHMMAMTAKFDEYEEEEDGVVRMFGVHRSDVFESHVAVIGGTGKYEGANGYAVVKVVNRVGFDGGDGHDEHKAKLVTNHKFLLFDVYLS